MNTVQSTGGGHGGSMKKVDKHDVSIAFYCYSELKRAKIVF